jgi:polysaccharide biosynthesis/export protein
VRKLLPYALVLIVLTGCAASAPNGAGFPQAPNSSSTAAVHPASASEIPDEPMTASLNDAELDALWRDRTEHLSSLGLGAGDVIQVSVAGLDELQKQEVRVDQDGSINLPLLGRFDVAGLSEQELTELLKTKLRKYVYQPDVQIFATLYNNRGVAVTGEVKNPGVITLSGQAETLRQVLQRAGGPSETAGRRLLLTPANTDPPSVGSAAHQPGVPQGTSASDDPQKLLVIDMDQRGDDRFMDLPVRPGDAIYLPPGGNVTVVGWVYYPKTVTVTPGLTVLQSIASAGGPLFAADKTGIKLIRQNSIGAPEIYTLNLNKIENLQEADIRVRDGDVVQVPYSIARIPGYGVYYALQSLLTFGPEAALFSGL